MIDHQQVERHTVGTLGLRALLDQPEGRGGLVALGGGGAGDRREDRFGDVRSTAVDAHADRHVLLTGLARRDGEGRMADGLSSVGVVV